MKNADYSNRNNFFYDIIKYLYSHCTKKIVYLDIKKELFF